MPRIAVLIARIAATTITFPVRSCAAATGAAAGIVSWERRLFACSPLSPEARRMRHHYRELKNGVSQSVGPRAVAHQEGVSQPRLLRGVDAG